MRISDWSSDVCSSDLRHRWPCARTSEGRRAAQCLRIGPEFPAGASAVELDQPRSRRGGMIPASRCNDSERSEEHTSELQSLMRISYAVFCLKKKKQPLQMKPKKSYYTTGNPVSMNY